MTHVRSTRTVKGIAIPAVGTWVVDPGHAEVGFIGRHLMLTRIRGRFTRFDATINIAEDLADSTVEATIDMASVDSGGEARDEHLRSADHFDVEHHPTARFRSTAISWDGGRTATLTGDLTIRDVTRPVELLIDYLGAETDPWGNEKAAFSAHGVIDRSDFGLDWNMVVEAGGLLVSKQIELILDFEANRKAS
jgi:polyisoprenoid-binding protein YceI